MTRRIPKSLFTLVELMVSLAIFSIIMVLLMQYFSTAQKLWVRSSAKAEMFENARIAMNLIENDLNCAYYSYGHNDTKIFFYPLGDAKQFGFAAMRSAPPNASSSSSLCEVQYKLLIEKKSCRLMINIMGDHLAKEGTENGDWDVTSHDTTATKDDNAFLTYDNTVYNVAKPKDNVDGWCEVIPYVLDFTFTLYDKSGNEIASSTGADFIAQASKMPYTVFYTLTMIDRDTFNRYLARHPDVDLSSSGAFDSFKADDAVKQATRKFSRQVTIERGQYD